MDNDKMQIKDFVSNGRYIETVGEVPGYLTSNGEILYRKLSINQIAKLNGIVHNYGDRVVAYKKSQIVDMGNGKILIVFQDVYGWAVRTPIIAYEGSRGGFVEKFYSNIDKNGDKIIESYVTDLNGDGKLD